VIFKIDKPLLLLILLFIYSHTGYAQTTEVRGKITDGKTKEPLSYANVRLKNTITATTADADGFYFIRTPEKSDTIVFSYLGYPTRSIKIQRGKSQEINVEMGAENIQLLEVAVKAGKRKKYIDTAANYVYFKVMQNRSQNRESNIASYKFEEYQKLELGLLNAKQKFINKWYLKPFRFVFDNKDTIDEGKEFIRGIIQESLTDVYYRNKPKGIRKYTKSTQITGIENNSITELTNYSFSNADVYDNIYPFAGKSFIAPFSPGALLTYRYFISDTQQLDNRTSYKIHFVGISKVDLALKGYAWIDSATWGIKNIYYRPNEKSNLNFISDYSVTQNFILIDNKSWLLKSEDLQTVGSLFKRKKAMAMLVQKSVDRRDIEVNIPLDDTLFKKTEQEFIAPDARSKGREFWEENRFLPLNNFERKVFWIHDTLPKVPAFKRYMWTIHLLTTAYFQAGPIEFGRFYKFVSKNNIEGIRARFGFRTNKDFSRNVQLSGYGAYGFKDKDWKYQLMMKAYLPSKNDRWRMLSMYYKYDLNVLGQENQLLTFDNVFTLLRGQLLSRMMKIREVHVDVENEWVRGFSSIMAFDNKTFYQIPGVFDFTTSIVDNEYRSVRSFNTTELSIDSRISIGGKYYKAFFYRYFIKTIYPVFLFKYNLGFLNLTGGNVTNYHKLMFTVQQRLSWQLGTTNYELKAAKIFGPAPYPISYVTAGNFGIIFDRFNYNMLREFEFVTDQFVSVFLEHHFDGFFLNKIPLVNKLRLREVFYIRGLWGSYSSRNESYILPSFDIRSPSKIPYLEASIGIENILNVFRVDFMWRLTYRNTPGVPNFMVKVGFIPNF
jgi:hypothetical protein